MTDDPSKGATLSQIRRRASRWQAAAEVIVPEYRPPVQLTLVPDVPKPTTAKKAAMKKEHAEQRVITITDEAVAAYNAILAKPNGLLPRATTAGIGERRKNVQRCIDVVKRICGELYGDTVITATFWDQYFGECTKDRFLSGNGEYVPEDWRPDFEYLTRPKTVVRTFEKAMAARGR